MDILDLMKERYSCRSFSSQKVEDDKIEKILTAAKVAPTARNLESQRILILTYKRTTRKIKCLYPIWLECASHYDYFL